jgi:ComF family protein
LNNWLKNIQTIFYPLTCFLCQAEGHQGLDLCSACLADFEAPINRCERCDIPLTSQHKTVCGKCLKDPPHFDRVRSLYSYQGLPRFLIQSLKFNGKLSCSKTMGELMARHLMDQADLPSAIVAVPLHPIRERERGFNQSDRIAGHIQRALKIPQLHKACTRTINTASQTTLKALERKRNLNKAFRFSAESIPEFIAVIDDVVTTGSTANEIAKTLKQAGVKRVEIWAFARA